MADIEAPSFSLGLDSDLLDSEPQISSVSQHSGSNKFHVTAAMVEDKDDDFETLIVDDSEPEYPDPHPKLRRLRRGPSMDATSSSVSAKAKVELHSRTVVDDEDMDVFFSQEDRRTGLNNQRKVIDLSTTENPWEYFKSEKSFCIPTPAMDEICEEYNRPMKHKSDDVQANRRSHVTRSSLDLDDSLPPAHRYFFHDDPRIQELVRSRLFNFSPLGNTSNRDLEQPNTSKIDYMGQFSCCESSKQAAKNIKDKKSSSSRKISRKSDTEDSSQGWVNPKLGVDKAITKGAANRKVHAAHQTAGHWLTGPDGKKVYVCKNGPKLTGRVAYWKYKENGAGFKQAKRKSATRKKKK